MNSGVISLQSLYQHIWDDRAGESLFLNSAQHKAYRNLAKELCQVVPEGQGFYLWGRYDTNGLWRNIYIGKVETGKTTHMRQRIYEGLDEEKECLMFDLFDKKRLYYACRINYSKQFQKYWEKIDRALKKAGSTHIIWVEVKNWKPARIRDVEADLIETLNPRANDKRPVPMSSFQDCTLQVIAEFRKHIHKERGRRYHVQDHGKKLDPN